MGSLMQETETAGLLRPEPRSCHYVTFAVSFWQAVTEPRLEERTRTLPLGGREVCQENEKVMC